MRAAQTFAGPSRACGALHRRAVASGQPRIPCSRLYALKPELKPTAPPLGLRSRDSNMATSSMDTNLPNNFIEMCHSPDNSVLPGSGPKKFLEASICRLYYFDEKQLHTFKELIGSMRGCRSALIALALGNILMSLVQASGLGEHHGHHAEADAFVSIAGSGLTIGDVAYWADSLMVAFLISYASGPFERVLRSRSNQMAYTFQGVNRLALIFQQLSIGSVAVSTVTALEAAAKFPPLVVGASAVFFGVAVVRSAAMWWTITRHASNNEEVSRTLKNIRDPNASQQMNLLDRWATFLAFGYLLQYEEDEHQQQPQPAMAAATAVATSTTSSNNSSTTDTTTLNQPVTTAMATTAMATATAATAMEYEFSLAEERLLRSLTEAASTAGLALGLQAFVTYMLTVADFGVGDMPNVVGNGINATNKAVMTAILFNACASYDRALHTAGSNDVEHLMDGLGKKGLTGLFDSLAVLSYAVAIATIAGLALPWLEENMLAKAVGDGLSHRSAEALLEVLEYTRAILRGI